jgi:hypothetical protein
MNVRQGDVSGYLDMFVSSPVQKCWNVGFDGLLSAAASVVLQRYLVINGGIAIALRSVRYCIYRCSRSQFVTVERQSIITGSNRPGIERTVSHKIIELHLRTLHIFSCTLLLNPPSQRNICSDGPDQLI